MIEFQTRFIKIYTSCFDESVLSDTADQPLIISACVKIVANSGPTFCGLYRIVLDDQDRFLVILTERLLKLDISFTTLPQTPYQLDLRQSRTSILKIVKNGS